MGDVIQVGKRMDRSSIATTQRLAFRLLIVAAFAALWPSPSVGVATATFCILLATGCGLAAYFLGETPVGSSLNRWHEAAVLFALGSLIFVMSQG